MSKDSIPKGVCGTVPQCVKLFDPLFRRPKIEVASAIDGKTKYPIQHKFGRDAGRWTIPQLLKITKKNAEMNAELLKVRRAFKRDPDFQAQQCRAVENTYWTYVKSNLKAYIKWLGKVFYREIGISPRMEGIPVNDDADCNEFYIQYFEDHNKIPVVYTDNREVNLSLCVGEKGVRPSWRKRESIVKTAKQFLKHARLSKAERHNIDQIIRGEDTPGLLYDGS